jgi:hypothetical protein
MAEKKTDWNTLAYRIVTLAAGVVEPWEAILTLSFFFAVVVTAYMADRDQFHIIFYGRIFMNFGTSQSVCSSSQA